MINELIKEAQNKFDITNKASSLYESKKELLLDFVNDKLARNPKISKLIGYNPLQMMYDNHLNHINFMINVFKLNNFELLVKIIPWVYRSYHSHGFSFDYFLLELNAWKEAINKNIKEKSISEIIKVYDWLIKKHNVMIKLSKKEASSVMSISPKYVAKKNKFLSFLLKADYKSCIKMAEEIAKTKNAIKDFYLHIVQPALYEIGELWEKGKISVAEEHLATSIVSRIMANMYKKIMIEKKNKGKAIITSAPNEFHEVGSRIVADLLELDGWDIIYLGANTPDIELFKMIKKVKPKFIGISVTMPFNLDRVLNIVNSLKKNANINKTKILVGGIVFNTFPELWRIIGADGYAKDAETAVSIVKQWAI